MYALPVPFLAGKSAHTKAQQLHLHFPIDSSLPALYGFRPAARRAGPESHGPAEACARALNRDVTAQQPHRSPQQACSVPVPVC